MSKIVEMNKFIAKWQEELSLKSDKFAGEFDFECSDFRANVEQFNLPSGFSYCGSGIEFRDDTAMHTFHEEDYCFLWFNTGDNLIELKDLRTGKCVNFAPNTVLIGKTIKNFEGALKYQGGKKYSNQCIPVSKTAALGLDIFSGLDNDKFSSRSVTINLRQRLVLRELAASRLYCGRLKEIFVESKILDLVCKSSPSKPDKSEFDEANLCEHDVKSIYKARERLLYDLQNPPTIKELARACAINEFKLKKGFKEIFGTTIYAALQNERLKIAKELLLSGDINVSEAANIVGYKSLGHFGQAFKSYYGALPTQIKKR